MSTSTITSKILLHLHFLSNPFHYIFNRNPKTISICNTFTTTGINIILDIFHIISTSFILICILFIIFHFSFHYYFVRFSSENYITLFANCKLIKNIPFSKPTNNLYFTLIIYSLFINHDKDVTPNYCSKKFRLLTLLVLIS